MNIVNVALAGLWFTASSGIAVANQDQKAGERLVTDTKQVVAEAFPDICGKQGEYCGFSVDPRRQCAREFVVNYPISKDNPSGKRGFLWVTLGNDRQIIFVSPTKDGACRHKPPAQRLSKNEKLS